MKIPDHASCLRHAGLAFSKLGARQFLLLLTALITPLTAGEVEEIQQAFIANRLAIKKWHMDISISVLRGADEHSGIDAITRIVTYNNGHLQRYEVTEKYLPQERFPGLSQDEYTDYDIWGQDETFHWCTQLWPKAKCAISIHDRSDDKMTMDPEALLFDVRWLAWGTESYEVHPGSTFANPLFVDWQVSDDRWQGISCKKMTFRRKTDNASSAYWFAPEMAYSILRSTYDDPEGPHYEGQFDVVQWRDSGIWFPQKAVYKVMDASGQLLRHEEQNIKILSINEDLDPALFTLQAINPPPGTKVYDNRPHVPSASRFQWDGKQVVPFREKTSHASKPKPSDNHVRWILLLNACILTLIGIVAVWRAFRKKSK